MSVILQKALGAGAPDVEDGICDAIFDGVTAESHPDWAGPNKFGGQDDGERWRFAFTLTADGQVLYQDGDPIVVDVLTNQTMGKKSNAYAVMAGLLTKAERDAIDAGEPVEGSSLEGRPCQVVIEHNPNGWPKVASVMPARKDAKAAAKAAKPAPAAKEPEAVDPGDDEEAALMAQLAAARAKKEAAAAKPDAAAEANAAKIAKLKADLAALEAEG